ncbi:MAG: reverse transcriptase domain-containing protein [Eubacteriales bacterium]|nr:reverse transcriptase domain-containing protein [Eubacteriales bacterium]
MNRIKVKYEEIISVDNLICADMIIRTRNDYSYGVAEFDKDYYGNIYQLHLDLINQTYIHSGYHTFHTTGSDNKRRLIHVCANYRDRIVQKALIIATKPYLVNRFVGNTYSSIPGRGAHKAIKKIKQVVYHNPINVLQLDIYHFFHEIDQACMANILSSNFKDRHIVWLCEAMMIAVDKGLVLGAEDSQWHANMYLTGIDHMILKECKPDHYFRYCDDLVLIDDSADKLKQSMKNIEEYMTTIKMQLKPSKRIFKLAEKRRMKGESGVGEGLDFLGYVFYQNHTDLRSSTKNRWRRRLHVLNRTPADAEISKQDIVARGALIGLLKHCNSKNLIKKWNNEYPNYFERLRRAEAKKSAAAKQKKEQLETLLEQTKRAS